MMSKIGLEIQGAGASEKTSWTEKLSNPTSSLSFMKFGGGL